MNEEGKIIGEIMQIQDRGDSVSEAMAKMQVAISLDKPIVGRHINEKDILHVYIPESHVKALLTSFQERLTTEEVEELTEYVELMRKKTTPFWGK